MTQTRRLTSKRQEVTSKSYASKVVTNANEFVMTQECIEGCEDSTMTV